MPTLKYLDPITGTYKAVSGSPGPSPTAPPPSGVWGTGNLSLAGSDPNFGDQTYVDNRGQLRVTPRALSTSVYPKAAADLPGTYPIGETIVQMTGAQSVAGGWPEGASGSVVTFRRSDEVDADAVASQWFYVTTSTRPRAYYRSGSGTAPANQWGPWVKAIDFVDTLSGGAASTIIVPNATNFTLTNSYVLVKNGVAYFTVIGTMKVASSAPGTTGDITNLALGTMAAEYFPAGSTLQQYAATSTGSGRPLNGYVLGGSGTMGIASIGGSAALAIGETVSLAGSYPLL